MNTPSTLNETMTEIEMSLLQILFSNEKYLFLFDKIKKEFFEDVRARKVFESGFNQYQKNIKPDFLIALKETKEFDFIGDIMLCNTLSINCPQYAQILFDNFINKYIKNATTKQDIEKIEEYKNNFNIKNDTDVFKLSDKTDALQVNYDNSGASSVLTLYERLDENVGCFCGGDYIVVAARPGVGKTALALNLARNFCIQGKKVLYCSLEMPLQQLQNRFICSEQGLNCAKYRSHGFSQMEYRQYQEGIKQLEQWNLNIFCGRLTTDILRTHIKTIRPDFVIIDHLGLMEMQGNQAIYEKTTIISKGIKSIALEYDIPIMPLVQLNRAIEARKEKTPIMSDLRDSGSIEQDADFIFFLMRDKEIMPNIIEILLSKNRHGVSHKKNTLKYNLETQRIYE